MDFSSWRYLAAHCGPLADFLLVTLSRERLLSPLSIRLTSRIYNRLLPPRHSDGAGLFCGVLKHLLDRGSNCPKVLAATHFHDVFREDLLDYESIPISFCHMQVMFTSIDGVVLDGGSSAGSNGTPRSGVEFASQDGRENVRKVGPGEKITYLYRWVRPHASEHGP